MASCPISKCKDGKVPCSQCDGKGKTGTMPFRKVCNRCHGQKTFACRECKLCDNCKGSGTGFLMFSCKACEGTGRVDRLSLFQRGDQYLKHGDYALAKKYLEKAANIQNSETGEAKYLRGVMSEQGIGVMRSHDEAIKWYRAARKNGHVGAKLALNNARKRNWKQYVRYCPVRNNWKGALQHKSCLKDKVNSVCMIDITHMEIKCNQCGVIWPLERSIVDCSCGNQHVTEFTKDILIVGANERIIRQDGDVIYVLDKSGKMIVGRRSYKNIGYV